MRKGNKTSKHQYYDRRRKNEEDWSKDGGGYKPKNPRKYENNYEGREYDYQYIHKDRKQYSREELLKLASKAFIEEDLLDDLTIKFDLVFTPDLRKPLGDQEESKEDRFVDHGNDNDRYQDRRDEYDDRDNFGDTEFKGKKEFVKFDDFENLDSDKLEDVDRILEKKCNRKYQEEDPVPEWMNEDYEGEVPDWHDVDTKDIMKETDDTEKWDSSNLKTFDKDQVKKSNYYDADDEDDVYYTKKVVSHLGVGKTDKGIRDNFNNYLDDDYKDDDEYEPTNKNGGWNQEEEEDEYERNGEKESLGGHNDEDITGLWKRMKMEEEQEEQKNKLAKADTGVFIPQKINQNFYEEELREKRKEAEQFSNILSMFAKKEENPKQGNKQAPASADLFGHKSGSNAQENKQNFVAPNLNSILGTFAGPARSNSKNQVNVGLKKNDSKSGTSGNQGDYSKDSHDNSDIDLITGPPPSVVKAPEEEYDEKKEKAKKEFQEKYLVMDKVLNQIVYDTLNSRNRQGIDAYSTNGANQSSAEKYCANNYKIFSFCMQGDIFSKVWCYKDKVGNIQGPYMSFDMDIWNGEGNYFSKSLLISANNKDYFPLQLYLDRDPKVLEVMQEVVAKQEQVNKEPPMFLNMGNMKMMYRGQQYPWIPPTLLPGQLPQLNMLPLPKGGVNVVQGQGKRNYHNQGKKNYNQMNMQPMMNNNKNETSSLLNELKQPPNKADPANNLKEMLGLPHDPAILTVTTNNSTEQKFPNSSGMDNGRDPGIAYSKKQSDDFPSLKSTLK
jgi:hypothetical protein